MGLSQALCSFFTHNVLETQEEAPTDFWVSLYVVFSLSSSLSCELSSLPYSSCTVSSDPSTQGVHWILLGFSFPVLRPRNFLKAVSWVKYRINLPWVLYLRGHSFFVAWCPLSWKLLFYIFCLHIFCCCFRWKDKPYPCHSILLTSWSYQGGRKWGTFKENLFLFPSPDSMGFLGQATVGFDRQSRGQ